MPEAPERFVIWAGNLRRLHRGVVLLGLGALAALGQEPVTLWPATTIALALIYAVFARTDSPRRAALQGWLAGTGYFMVSLSWIIEPFLIDIARHGWMALPALILLCGGLALFWAGAFGVACLAGGGAAAFIAAFVLAEGARGWVFTGFPWAQIGHVWVDTPLLQWAAYVGSLGLSAVILLAGVGLCHAAMGNRRLGGLSLIAVAALYAGGNMLNHAAPPPENAPTVRLIQPNAAQHEKWDPDKLQVFFDRQMGFTRAGEDRPDLVVWPETAIPVLLNNADPTLRAISDAAGGAPVVLGVQRIEGARLFNSLVAIGARGDRLALYDKHHLVPFGEYIPFGDTLGRFGITGMAARDGNGYSAGPGAQVIDMGHLGRALPLICYEGVFPQDVRAAPQRADFMLLITNDAWFGQISGPYQHLAQARLRSVEQGLPMIRVANTGVSAMIDARGRLTAQLPLGQAGWIDAALPPPHAPTVYARLGDLPPVIFLVLMLGMSLIYNRRSRTCFND